MNGDRVHVTSNMKIVTTLLYNINGGGGGGEGIQNHIK